MGGGFTSSDWLFTPSCLSSASTCSFKATFSFFNCRGGQHDNKGEHTEQNLKRGVGMAGTTIPEAVNLTGSSFLRNAGLFASCAAGTTGAGGGDATAGLTAGCESPFASVFGFLRRPANSVSCSLILASSAAICSLALEGNRKRTKGTRRTLKVEQLCIWKNFKLNLWRGR